MCGIKSISKILILLTVLWGQCRPLGLMASDIRVMSYNVHNATGLDGKLDTRRIASVIDKADPDVVAIQEVDSITRRSGGRNLLAEIAGYAGMRHIYASAIDFDGGKYGIGILCRERPLREIRATLPGREEQRLLLAVEFNDYVFACTHLSLTEQDRLASLAIIDSIASLSDKPFIISGDFNSSPGDAFMKAFGDRYEIISTINEMSFPADRPVELLDYIAIRRSPNEVAAVKRSHIVKDSVASDHRPVYADVMLSRHPDRIISVKPYLHNPADGGITVMWQTSVSATGIVEYGTSPDSMTSSRTLLNGQADWGTLHRVRLTGLIPDKKYYYRVISQEIAEYGAYHKVFGNTATSELKSFTLPSPDTKDFTAVVFNDLHQNKATFRALCNLIRDIDYDFTVLNGDCIDDPASLEQAIHFLRELNDGLGADSIPVIYLRGNHEIRGAYSTGLGNLIDYTGGRPYSAFNWGDTRFVTLDCGEDKPDSTSVYYGLNDFTRWRMEQAQFLKEELKSKDFREASKKVLMHHAPVYGLDVDYTDYNPCLELWGPILEKAPFDVALNAHTHRFSFHPRGTRGNNYPVVVGGGPDIDNSTVMILTRKDKELEIKVLNAAGKTLLETKL